MSWFQVINHKGFFIIMNFYETIFVVRQDATTSQVESLANDYTTVIKDHKGEVSKTEFSGLRNLAYPIKKNKKGHFVLMNVSSEPDAIKEIERLMRLNENILRYLSVRVEELDPNPSALMQQRNYREERYRQFDDESQTEGLDIENLQGEEI